VEPADAAVVGIVVASVVVVAVGEKLVGAIVVSLAAGTAGAWKLVAVPPHTSAAEPAGLAEDEGAVAAVEEGRNWDTAVEVLVVERPAAAHASGVPAYAAGARGAREVEVEDHCSGCRWRDLAYTRIH
jgi:hypothetical protein